MILNHKMNSEIVYCMPINLNEMILAEQERNPKFVNQDVQAYINKIREHASFLTSYSDQSCQGFVAFYCNNYSSRCAFITLVLIVPEFRGKKIAHIMLKEVLNQIQSRNFKECRLEVDKDNLSAINLYIKLGFNVESCNDNILSMAYIF